MTALELSIDQRAALRTKRSTRSTPWQLEYAREIGEKDLLLLAQTGSNLPDKPLAPLAAIRDPHHTMAKMVAEGKDPITISRICGYTPARIKTFLQDPSFQELVVHYQEESIFADGDVTLQVKHLALVAGATLRERLEENPDSFTNEELRKIHESGLDRIGHGPSSSLKVTPDGGRVLQALAMALETTGRVIPKAELETTYEVINGKLSAPESHEPLESGDDP